MLRFHLPFLIAVHAVLVLAAAAAAAASPQAEPKPSVALQCGIRVLAYEFATQLQPERGPMPDVAAGLSLTLHGNGTALCSPHGRTHADEQQNEGQGEEQHSVRWPSDFPQRDYLRSAASPAPPISQEATPVGSVVYVSYVDGDDSNPGTPDKPLRTIAAAVAAVSKLPPPRDVLLQPGLHSVAESVVLRPANSNTSIRAAGPGQVTVSGAVHLQQPVWDPVSPPSGHILQPGVKLLKTSLPNSVTLDLLEAFENATTRLVASRWPNGDPEADQSNYHGKAKGWLPARDFGIATVHNSSFTRPGSFGKYAVGVGGPAGNFNPPVSYWAQPHPGGGGASTYSIVSGVVVDSEHGMPELQSGQPGGFAFVMQPGSWGSWVFSIGNTTRATPGSNATNITFAAGGFQEARGTGSPTKGGGGFYLANRFELLDHVGEFWHDAVNKELFLAVPASADQGPTEMFLPQVSEIFRLAGTQAEPVVGVEIAGLTIRHTRPTYMQDYTVPSGGDYSVHKGAAVHLNGTRNCTVDRCVFDQLGGNAVWLSDFNRGANITANEMKRLGENGIGLTGSTNWEDGTGGNQPRHNLIHGNLIHHVGLYTKQSCAIFSALACQNRITNNILFHGPRALLNMNDNFGGGSVIDHNLFFGAVLETKDHGPFNSWDRLPFLTEVRNGTPSMIPAQNHLTRNLFFSGSPFAIDTDDGSNALNASSNVVFKQPLFKDDYGGHSQSYSKNVALYGGGCIHSNIAPRDPHGRERCHFSSPCADKDPTTSFTDNHCVAATSGIRCTTCKPGTTCALIQGNTYYSATVNATNNGSAVCPPRNASLESGSVLLEIPTDKAALQLCRHTLGWADARE